MNSNMRWFAIAALILAVMIFGQTLGGDEDAGALSADGSIRVTIASSSTKKEWLDSAVDAFNRSSKADSGLQVDGKPIFVEVLLEELEPGEFDHYRSGTMVSDTLAGKIKPTVVSPAEETWILKLSADWKSIHGAELITGKPVALVRTPLVIAMWQSRATALGCWPEPTPDCTWQRLSELAGHPDGWGMVGRPEWGMLKFGYGYVGESNSGTLTAVLLCMSGAGKLAGLSIDEVDVSSGCGQRIAVAEQAKVHSGKKSDWLLGWLKAGGPEYLDAVTTYEQEVIEFNRENGDELREPLVAAYPQDGTVVVEHPYAVLDGADWVSPEAARAAQVFGNYLLSDERQQDLATSGLRPADPAVKPGPPIERQFGANPDAFLLPVVVPDSLTFDRITEVWHRVKKHAVIALVFDKSGSMQGEKLTAALTGAKAFVEAMDPEDQLIWIPFDGTVYPGKQGLKSVIGEALIGDISSTAAAGGTALYDAIAIANQAIEKQRASLGTSVRYGIVVLSDGKDTGSSRASISTLQAALNPSESDPTRVQIHTIGIGTDADRDILTRISDMANGKYWDAKDPDRVLDAYEQIAVHY